MQETVRAGDQTYFDWFLQMVMMGDLEIKMTRPSNAQNDMNWSWKYRLKLCILSCIFQAAYVHDSSIDGLLLLN